jgi:ribonuclease-3
MIKYLKSILSLGDRTLRNQIHALTGTWPHNIQLYKQAFRHSSVSKQIAGTGIKNSNERLEYLGDSVLNMVVAHTLFLRYPFKDEGFLTQLRSKIVSRDQLNAIGLKIGIENLIHYDRKLGGPRNRLKSMPGNTLEAFIGALFLDRGFEVTQSFICNRLLKIYVDIEHLVKTESNFKSRIINWCQKDGKTISFDVLDNAGNGHDRQFKVQVIINSEPYGIGMDFNKRKAEQIAAEKTCALLGV